MISHKWYGFSFGLFINSLLFFFPLILQQIQREEFEDALKEIQDEGLIVVMGKTTIRIC